MLNQYVKQNPLNRFQQPITKIINLNVRTMQNLSYMVPTDMMTPQRPEQFLEKNVEIMFQNSHKALDYMRDMFLIMEHSWFDTSDHSLKHAHEALIKAEDHARNIMSHSVQESYREAKTGGTVSVKKTVQRTAGKVSKKSSPKR